MAQFQYRAADPEGKIVEGTIEAAEESGVVLRLQDRGLIPIKIVSSSVAGKGGRARVAITLPSFRRRLTQRDLLTLTQELAALLAAGLPLDRSLATLGELAPNPELKRVVGEVLQAVRGGKGLAESLGEHPFFPPLYVSMVRAGEVGGFLEPALQRLAEYLERAQMLADEVKSAMTYPVLLVFALGGSMLVLLVYVLPKFATLFEDMGQALPLAPRIVLGLSAAIRTYWWAALLFVGLTTFGLRRWVATPAGRLSWDSWKLRAPLLGNLLRKVEVARIGRTLGTLLKSGVSMVQALEIIREIATNVVIGRALADVEVGVREGEGMAEPLAKTGVFPTLAVQMIAVGEETGRLDDLLLKVADHFDREVRLAVQSFTRILEPAMILIMGLGVGFIVVSMLSAIFSVNEMPM